MNARALLGLGGVLALSLVATSACGGGQPSLTPVYEPRDAEYTFRATGRAAIPDGLADTAAGWVRAERAARVDGYRKLAEQIYGVEVQAGTTVRDATLDRDVIESRVQAMVRGAQVTDTRRRVEMGVVEMDVVLRLGREFQEFLFSLRS